MPAPAESLVNTGLTGFFTKNSAKVHSGSDNQRQSKNAANPRGSPHCGLPRTVLAQKSANALILPLPSSSAELGKSTKIRPKEALNPSPGHRDAAPPRRRPHSGSQGRTRGFCDLCRQLLLHLLTLQLGHLPLVTLLQDIVHRDDIRYAPGDVKSGRMTEVFSIAICHILCYNALKLNNGTA